MIRNGGRPPPKLVPTAGPAPDLLLAAEVGVVPEPQELVHSLPEDSRGGGVGPPGSGPEQPAPDPETDKYKFLNIISIFLYDHHNEIMSK